MNRQKTIAKSIYKTIYELLERGNTPEDIYKIIIYSTSGSYSNADIYYSEDYLNRVFRSRYGVTLLKYIKQLALIRAYKHWVNQGAPILTRRAEVANISEFKTKFVRAFDRTPEEVLKKKIPAESLVMDETLIEALENMAGIKDFRVNNGVLDIEYNKDELMLDLLRHPIIRVEKKELDDSDYYGLSLWEKGETLVNSVLSLGKKDNGDEEDEFANSMINFLISSYNLEAPDPFESYYFFHYNYSKSDAEYYKENIDIVLKNRIIFHIQKYADTRLRDIANALNAIYRRDYNPVVTISELSNYSQFDTEKLIENIWYFFSIGVLNIEKPEGYYE